MTNKKPKQKSKKELVLGNSQRNNKLRNIALSMVVVAIAALTVYFVQSKQGGFSDTVVKADTPKSISADTVSFPVTLFQDGQARHFEHTANGMTIRYFILKSSDNVIRAAFDACDVCWRAGKGYVQSGDDMVCQNCGRRFPSAMINEVKGGCNPAPLPRTLQGEQLVIRIQDILQGGQYFNFKERA